MSTPPDQPKVYHIVHVDRLSSIIADGCLWSDAVMVGRLDAGTSIGIDAIKQRRLNERSLSSHSGLFVGQCVPFYFCPRSVMLYIIRQGNHLHLRYRGGQGPIVHLEADLKAAVAWATTEGLRWAFTLSNAGAYYFEDRCDIARLSEVNWAAVRARQWSGPGVPDMIAHGKQAEFLVERQFAWKLVERVGVLSSAMAQRAAAALGGALHRPRIEILPDWYY